MTTITSGNEKIMFIADLIHSDVLLFPSSRMGLCRRYQYTAAVASRIKILQQLAAYKTKTFAYHLPYPGLGMCAKGKKVLNGCLKYLQRLKAWQLSGNFFFFALCITRRIFLHPHLYCAQLFYCILRLVFYFIKDIAQCIFYRSGKIAITCTFRDNNDQAIGTCTDNGNGLTIECYCICRC